LRCRAPSLRPLVPNQKRFQNVELCSAAMIDRDHFVIVHDLLQRLIGKNYDACDHAVAVIIPSTKERDILPTDYSGPPSTPKNGAGVVLCPAGAIEKSVHAEVSRNTSFPDVALLSSCRVHPGNADDGGV
jgi:hypothetical protein